jgi:hypothetical protein
MVNRVTDTKAHCLVGGAKLPRRGNKLKQWPLCKHHSSQVNGLRRYRSITVEQAITVLKERLNNECRSN